MHLHEHAIRGVRRGYAETVATLAQSNGLGHCVQSIDHRRLTRQVIRLSKRSKSWASADAMTVQFLEALDPVPIGLATIT
jgi:hypothetical protein